MAKKKVYNVNVQVRGTFTDEEVKNLKAKTKEGTVSIWGVDKKEISVNLTYEELETI